MQAQVKYESEVKSAVLGDRTITVKNLTPVFSPQEQDKRNREIERRLLKCSASMPGSGGRPESSLLYGGGRGIIYL